MGCFAFAAQREADFQDGCLAVRKAVLDKMKAQTAPGPIYNPKPRVLSTEKSLRNVTFGTGPARYNDEPEHNRRRMPRGHHEPGPQTYDPRAIRRAISMQSNKPNVSKVKFGTGKRDCNNEGKCQSPSPAEYDPEMIRRGIRFSKSGLTTNIKFGTAKNNDSRPCDKPGPQAYDPEAIRRGVRCTKQNRPSVKFGDPPAKRAESRLAKSSLGQPGPQEYDTESIRRGVYNLSTKKRPAGVRFTTGPRTYNDVEERERASKSGKGGVSCQSGDRSKFHTAPYNEEQCQYTRRLKSRTWTTTQLSSFTPIPALAGISFVLLLRSFGTAKTLLDALAALFKSWWCTTRKISRS